MMIDEIETAFANDQTRVDACTSAIDSLAAGITVTTFQMMSDAGAAAAKMTELAAAALPKMDTLSIATSKPVIAFTANVPVPSGDGDVDEDDLGTPKTVGNLTDTVKAAAPVNLENKFDNLANKFAVGNAEAGEVYDAKMKYQDAVLNESTTRNAVDGLKSSSCVVGLEASSMLDDLGLLMPTDEELLKLATTGSVNETAFPAVEAEKNESVLLEVPSTTASALLTQEQIADRRPQEGF
jgi:hypothetical protein